MDFDRISLHKITEFGAIFAAIIILYIGTQQDNKYYRAFLIIFAILSFIIDLGLLLTWPKK